jgi:hypothetical protein
MPQGIAAGGESDRRNNFGEQQSMPKSKPSVIVTRRLPDAIETRMRELFDVRLNAEDRKSVV